MQPAAATLGALVGGVPPPPRSGSGRSGGKSGGKNYSQWRWIMSRLTILLVVALVVLALGRIKGTVLFK